MSYKDKGGLLVAVAVFLFGSVWMYVMIQRSSPPAVDADRDFLEIAPQVQEALHIDRYETKPTREGLDGVLQEIHARVVSISRERAFGVDQVLGKEAMCEDLGKAFTERVRMLMTPSFDRDFTAMTARGDPRNRNDAVVNYEKYASFTNGMGELAPLSLVGIQVELVQRSGGHDVVRQRRIGQGFGVVTSIRNTNQYPVSDDPVQSGQVVLEVSMPMMRYDHMENTMKGGIIGYRFAWSGRRHQWVPYESFVYHDRNSAFSPPIL